jgi:ferritin-like metal-binding protein YciE
MKLFEDELKDIYWVEKTLAKTLPGMMKKTSHPELTRAIKQHAAETLRQVKKVEKVFRLIGKKPQAKKCDAMAGILKEARETMKEADAGAMRDAVIIVGGQKIEHYEIAAYGTLCCFAEIIGLDEAAEILSEVLEEEKNADATLTEVALEAVNIEAAEEDEDETEED